MRISDHLEDNIHRVIADIRPQMLEKVIDVVQIDYIRASRGSPMPEIIFKISYTFEEYPHQVLKTAKFPVRSNNNDYCGLWTYQDSISRMWKLARSLFQIEVWYDYETCFRSDIFYVKDTPYTGRPVIENVDKITEIIEVDWLVSSSIAQELKIDHKTVLNHLRKVGFEKKLDV
ncbi:histone-lysine N-methyltransferase SETMAR [Trichonephila clavipes]|nr:histone-lysine N-methyltransferase SETMAR [Trichonephila clavipes]